MSDDKKRLTLKQMIGPGFDRFGLIIAVIIGMGTTFYLCFNIVADPWGSLVLGVMGGIIPLLSARFRINRAVAFFWISVFVITYSDVSMVLSMTDSQARVAEVRAVADTQTPPELARLQTASDTAQKTLDELLAQQRDARTVAFVQILTGQITDARADRDKAQAEERAWKPVAEKSARVNSHDVFMAVPTAVMSLDLSRWMTLVFALLIAIIYQGTVIATVSATVKRANAEARASAPKGNGKGRGKGRGKATIKAEKKEETVAPVTEPVPISEFTAGSEIFLDQPGK